MRIPPVTTAPRPTVAGPVAAPHGVVAMPNPTPRPGGPRTDAERMRSTVAFTGIIAEELATAVARITEGSLESAVQWVGFAEQNFETIHRFARDTPALVAAGVDTSTFAAAGAAYQLGQDTLRGIDVASFTARATAITEQARAIGTLVQSLIDAG